MVYHISTNFQAFEVKLQQRTFLNNIHLVIFILKSCLELLAINLLSSLDIYLSTTAISYKN